jgi:hypothetical protein
MTAYHELSGYAGQNAMGLVSKILVSRTAGC